MLLLAGRQQQRRQRHQQAPCGTRVEHALSPRRARQKRPVKRRLPRHSVKSDSRKVAPTEPVNATESVRRIAPPTSTGTSTKRSGGLTTLKVAPIFANSSALASGCTNSAEPVKSPWYCCLTSVRN